MRPLHLVLVALFVLTMGCKHKALVRELDSYRYRITIRPTMGDFALRLNGQLLASTNGEYVIPRNVRLSDPRTTLVAVRSTSCGIEETPLEPAAGYNRSEEVERLDAAHYGTSVAWNVFPRETWDTRSLRLYIDNLDNEKAITLKTGTVARVIGAQSSETVVIPVGHCTEATTVTIDGELLGTAEPTEQNGHTLVDAAGGHCYLVDTTVYGISGTPEPPQLFTSTRDRRMHPVGTIKNLFKPNPLVSTVSVEVGRETEATDIQRALLQVPCAAPPVKRKKHGTARAPRHP